MFRRLVTCICLVGSLTSAQSLAAPSAHVVTQRGSCLLEPETSVVTPTAYVAPNYPNAPTGMVGVSPAGRITLIGVTVGLQSGVGDFEDSALQVVDTATGQVRASIPHAGNWFVVSPDGGRAYVPASDKDGANALLLAYRVPVGTLVRSAPLPSVATALAVSPGGAYIAVATAAGIRMLTTDTMQPVSEISVLAQVKDVVFSPAGDRLYVSARTDSEEDELLAFDRSGHLLWSMPTGGPLRDLLVSPDATRLYGSRPASQDILAVNLPLRQIIGSIPVGGIPYGMAITPGGASLVVNAPAGTMATIDTVKRQVVATVRECPDRGGMYVRGTAFVAPMASSLPIAVEFYHAGFGHYFLTNNAQEVDVLDTDASLGWTRTGQRFNVFTEPGPGRVAVCRFFTTAFGSKSSHFFAPRGLGCEPTFSNPDWQYEGDVFYATVPDATGQCAGGEPVYRVYNNGQGGAPNHRLTPSLETQQTMLAEGWIAEGAGVGIGMCAAPDF